MESYDILKEAEAIAAQYISGKADYNDVFSKDWVTISEEIKNLLIEVHQIAKALEISYLEALKQGDREWMSLLWNKISSRPRLGIADASSCFELERIERETEFEVRSRLWIREVHKLLET